jgi:hypothetical protein
MPISIADDAEAIAKRLREINPKALAPKRKIMRLIYEIPEENNDRMSGSATWLQFIKIKVQANYVSQSDMRVINMKVIEEERYE